MSRARRARLGFTLIEVMIVVAILGVITAIAYPSYTDYVVKSRRAQAKADLIGLAQALERERAVNLRYFASASAASAAVPADYYSGHSPRDAAFAERDYTLSFCGTPEAHRYVLIATPATSAQSADGALFYWSDGRRGWDRNNNGSGNALEKDEQCWDDNCRDLAAMSAICS